MSRALLLMKTWMALALVPPAWTAEPDANAPGFNLPLRGTDQRVDLDELRGRIIVLDFFAHWCVPCARSSAEVEEGIRNHYSRNRGNAHAVPVSVFAVNIDAALPHKTEAFIKRSGMQQVLDDPNGEVFQEYGGSSLPFLVVIDATGAGAASSPPRIAYRQAGFEGVAKLRRVIDAIEVRPGNRVPPVASPPPSATIPPRRSNVATPLRPHEAIGLLPKTNAVDAAGSATDSPPPAPRKRESAIHKVGSDSAMLWASDIFLTDEFLQYRQTRPRSEVTLSVSHGHTELDYVPEYPPEEDNHVENERYGFQTTGRFRVGDHVTLVGNGGAYDGYADYRSLWIDEHFRQMFSGRAGYQKAHPWGCNVSGGLRWEFVPASAFVQGDLIYLRDVISPGYEVSLAQFPPRLVRFRDTYDTVSGRLTLENVLTPRLRVRQELQITDTTDRDLRFALRTSLNCALAEHWVARLAGGYTEEQPQFEAWFGELTLERDWNETWFVSLFGRYYSDQGQVEDALLAENTASPPLETYHVGLGLRWQGLKSSAKLAVGPYFTRYGSTANSANLFGELYQDRDWLSLQFAFAHEF